MITSYRILATFDIAGYDGGSVVILQSLFRHLIHSRLMDFVTFYHGDTLGL